MYAARLWSVRHARGLHRVYEYFSRLAPAFAPLLRLIGERRAEALLHPLERAAKGFMFDCRECGQCVLSATGMACPMNCPKEMRNGPCGGVREGGRCEVRPDMRCVWVEATEGTKRIAPDHLAHPTPLLPAIDVRKHGSSTWIQVVRGRPDPAFQPPVGDRTVAVAEYGPFEQACNSGRFVVTVEVAPPDSADPQALLARAGKFDGLVDAINITDGAGGNCHMSSVAASAMLAAHGYSSRSARWACRDRNRIAMQGDVLGAAALGVKQRALPDRRRRQPGRPPAGQAGVRPRCRFNLLHIAAQHDGDRGSTPRGGAGAAARLSSSAPPRIPSCRPTPTASTTSRSKIDAGARFIQTQFCFDLDRLRAFMDEACRAACTAAPASWSAWARCPARAP
jgi:methylenetetrahydrofolate reductase (NADPH)